LQAEGSTCATARRKEATMSSALPLYANDEPLSSFEQYRLAREILRAEGSALISLSERLEKAAFCEAVDLIHHTRGAVIVTGMGKAGLVGQKIAATLASTGTRSHYVHPAEAVHGDLGRIHRDDVVLVLSYSGETEEITRLLPTLKHLRTPIIAITGKTTSSLAGAADVVLDLGAIREACPLGLAPSTSTTAMLAMGDALALVVSRMRGFGPEDFARYHPAGSLGRKLAKVEDAMRALEECRVAPETLTVREVFVQHSRPGRRAGAIMITAATGELAGIFTDSDLAKLLERKRDAAIDGPISDVMTRQPQRLVLGAPLTDALEILSVRKISELPIVDRADCPVGMIDITDVVGMLPREEG
jgi:arabinose-5-phosphate isomerase